MSDRGENAHGRHPEWVVESRKCPFDELPARICGCPEGERIVAEELHLIRGTE